MAGVMNDRVEYVRDPEDLIYEAFQVHALDCKEYTNCVNSTNGCEDLCL